MVDIQHSVFKSADGIHILPRWVNTQAFRLALVPTSDDVGGAYHQTDDNTLWYLANNSPISWQSYAPSVQPDNTWSTGVSHINPAHTVRLIGNNIAPQGGLNIIQFGQGTSTGTADRTDFLVFDASTQISFRIGGVTYGSFWSHGSLPGFLLSKPRIQFINTIPGQNSLLFYEALSVANPVSMALILMGQGATGTGTTARAGAIVVQAGAYSVASGGGGTPNDARISGSAKGGVTKGNVVLGFWTNATDDTTDVPPVAANGLEGGLILAVATTAPTSAPTAQPLIYVDPTTKALMIWNPGDGAPHVA